MTRGRSRWEALQDPERGASARPEIQTKPAVVNRQSRVGIDLARMRGFIRRLLAELHLKGCAMTVGLVDDGEMARLNARFRGRRKATDVLSFPWKEQPDSEFQISNLRFELPDRAIAESEGRPNLDRGGFLGDIVISADAARRHARAEGHSTENEIRWLILHGALHLCGFDHEQDRGEMTALELRLRERLGI